MPVLGVKTACMGVLCAYVRACGVGRRACLLASLLACVCVRACARAVCLFVCICLSLPVSLS
jgi:hypothetical protein